MATADAMAEVLKTIWGPGIVEAIKNDTPLYDQFREMDAREWGGRGVEYPIKVARTEGVGAGSPGGALRTAGQARFQSYRIPMTYRWGRVSFDGPSMKASEGSRAAFNSIMDIEMKGLLDTLKADAGRM